MKNNNIITDKYIETIKSKSNYQNNLDHNGGRYKHIMIHRFIYNNETLYSHDLKKWYKKLSHCKMSISKIY